MYCVCNITFWNFSDNWGKSLIWNSARIGLQFFHRGEQEAVQGSQNPLQGFNEGPEHAVVDAGPVERPAAAVEEEKDTSQQPVVARDQDPQFQRFTYEKLSAITESFNTRIGRGGFGDVFLGKLEDGTPVAVKMMRSQRSSLQTRQGDSELSAEVCMHPAFLIYTPSDFVKEVV